MLGPYLKWEIPRRGGSVLSLVTADRFDPAPTQKSAGLKMMGTVQPCLTTLLLLGGLLSAHAQAQPRDASLVPADGGASAARHFDPHGKPPSKFTIELRNGQKAELPFTDKRDFDEAKRGFIAEPPYTRITADAGYVAWDMNLRPSDYE